MVLSSLVLIKVTRRTPGEGNVRLHILVFGSAMANMTALGVQVLTITPPQDI
jgi:hypothetical protein